jgi:homoserine dehydrogenase
MKIYKLVLIGFGNTGQALARLQALAAKHDLKFFFESTVMNGAPIFSSFRQLPDVGLSAIWGVLNSTTNLILSRMEAGDSFDEAVRHSPGSSSASPGLIPRATLMAGMPLSSCLP